MRKLKLQQRSMKTQMPKGRTRLPPGIGTVKKRGGAKHPKKKKNSGKGGRRENEYQGR